MRSIPARAAASLVAICLSIPAAQRPAFPSAIALDNTINTAIERELIPGAVLVIGHRGAIVYRKAYGSRALIPKREPMTVDTIFDAASLTKVIATTSSIMKLFEQGKLRLNDPVTEYLPEFQGGHSPITVRNLMTHFSGLRPDLDLEPTWSGYQTGIDKALIDKPRTPPGTRFVYSDINFILLGEIVHRLSGKTLAGYAKQNIFDPLEMRHTRFLPLASWVSRIAPTEIEPLSGLPIRAVVHDPTARDMGGIAGHAGLFTTADDLARFCQMMLNLGTLDGKRLFSTATVQKFTSPQSPANQAVLRGLGWDIDSPFSGNRGELFPIGSYGHTGFTGTSVWLDPTSQTYVILLTNSVHPHRGKSLTSLRARVATLTAAAVGIHGKHVRLTSFNETLPGSAGPTVAANANVLTGLDVLAEQKFAPLQGKRLGLITNHTGVSQDGKRNTDMMRAAGLNIVALLSPEHGLAGAEDPPVFSLFNGPSRRISQTMLTGIDTVIYDIQDVGARFYTYSCTLLSSMEECAKRKIPFYVLDRPNPITGVHVEGPVLEKELESFVGCFEMPVRHGLTFGELAGMFNGERKTGADLHVIPVKNWDRGEWFDSTGLTWVNPSPSMRSLNAATLYPGVAMLEASPNYSVGRGTDAPFEQIGSDWMDGRQVAALLNTRFVPGVRVYPTRFQPATSNFKNQIIEGVRFVVTDRNVFDATRFGLEIGSALEKLYPGRIPWDENRFLIGSRAVVEAEKSGVDPRTTGQNLEESLKAFVAKRERYLLYK